MTSRREALVCAAGSAELFLAMRAAYTASLAAMSATGYCAGVGDRHMGNIMLHASGRLVPIDFGCVVRSLLKFCVRAPAAQACHLCTTHLDT